MSIVPRTADRLTGLVLLILGIAMLAGGYTMDRLEIRQIHPASIPGLVPMGLGAAMIICSLLLIVSASSRTDEQLIDSSSEEQTGSVWNLLLCGALCIAYAVGLLGNMPFMIATGIFIFLFAAIFSRPDEPIGMQEHLKSLILLALFAAVFAAAISLLFQYGFLVRLP